MTDDSADSMLSLHFSPDACASQTSLSPSVEDAKTQKYSVFCLGTLNSCTNKHEAAQLAGLHSQRCNNPEVQGKAFSADQSFPIPSQRKQSCCQLARGQHSQLWNSNKGLLDK